MPLLRTHMPSGPLIVGCCDIMVGRTKEGSLLRLFYPTDAKQLPADDHTWTKWFLGEEYSKGIASFAFPKPLQPFVHRMFTWQTQSSVVPSVWCGRLLQGDQPLPVVVFSHGLGANRSLYSSVCSQLASYGYFVAALEHRDGSANGSFTLSEKGEREWMKFARLKTGETEFTQRSTQLATRVEESRRTLTVLEGLNAGTVKDVLESPFNISQLKGKLDLSRPIMAGHSFGGCTAIATAYKDDRFKLCVALDPWLFPLKDAASEVCPGVRQPTICISTETFQTPANLKAMSTLSDDISTFVTIKGTVHQNQSDTPFLLGPAGRLVGGTGSKLNPGTAMEINNALMLSFIHERHGPPHPLVPQPPNLKPYYHLMDCGPLLAIQFRPGKNQQMRPSNVLMHIGVLNPALMGQTL